MATVNEASFYRLSGWLSFFVDLGGLVYGILLATIVEGASGAVVNTWFLLAIFGGLYAGRLAEIIDPAERITLIPPLLYGLFVHPVLYVWLGRELLRMQVPSRAVSSRRSCRDFPVAARFVATRRAGPLRCPL